MLIIVGLGFYRHSSNITRLQQKDNLEKENTNELSIKLRLSNICLENQGYDSSASTSGTEFLVQNHHIKTTPVNVLHNDFKDILVECYSGEDIVGLYVVKVKDDNISNLWYFPPKDESKVYISNINIQDIDKDGGDEISYQTYYHGGPCTWYNNNITVYSIKYNTTFSKSIFANAVLDTKNEYGCSPDYKVEKSKYSGDIKQVSSGILEFINSVDLVVRWLE